MRLVSTTSEWEFEAETAPAVLREIADFLEANPTLRILSHRTTEYQDSQRGKLIGSRWKSVILTDSTVR